MSLVLRQTTGLHRRQIGGVLTDALPPGAGENDTPSTPSIDAPWINTGNVANLTLSIAAVLTTVGIAPYVIPFLRCNDFGFSVPSTATILGVRAQVFLGTVGSDYTDDEVRLGWGVSAANTSDNRAKSTALTTDATLEYGGLFDRWGAALTPTIVNSSDFSLLFKPGRATGTLSSICSVGLARVAVRYRL